MRLSATQTRTERDTVRTLHVDDDELFGSMTAELLELTDARLSVVTVTSARAGLDRLAEGDIDCVVSDYDMPGGNGIEFLETVREQWGELPFILFTGKGSEEIASDAVSTGVTDYLQKESGVDQYTVLANRIVNATEKYWAEADLEHRIRQQEALATLGRTALEADRLGPLFDEAVNLAADRLGCDYATVFEWRPERDDLTVVAGVGWNDGTVGAASVSAGAESQAGYTLVSSESVVVVDLSAETRFSRADLLVDHDVVSGVCVVIDAPEKPWGVLGVYTTDAHTFAAQDVTFLENVANVLAAAIDRHETEARLRESESRFREIAELSPDGIFRTDTDGMFTYVSPASETLLGRSAEDLVGTPFTDFVADTSHDVALKGIRRVFDDEVVRGLALTLVDADGTPFDVEVSASPVSHGGDVEFVQGFARDVTEQHERERALQHERERFEALVDLFPNGGVFLFDEDLRFTMAGGDELESVGVPAEKILGRTLSQVFPPENVAVLEPNYRAALAGEKRSFEDGWQGQQYHVQTVPLRNDDGEVISGMAVAQNITERVERKRALQRTTERYQTVVDNFPGGVYLFDEDLRIVAAGGRELARMGLPPDEIEGKTPADLTTPEDPEPLERLYRAALGGDEQELEYEWRGRNYHVQAIPLSSADDEDDMGMSVFRDVTARTEHERELQTNRERYQTLVDNFPGGVVLFDNDLRVIAGGGTEFDRASWNPEAARGELLRDNLTPEGATYLDTHYRAALDGEARTFEYEASGTHYHLQTIPLRDGTGEVTAGMAVTQNVTERIERDRKLDQLRQLSHALMYTETKTETARVAVDAAHEVIDAPLSGFHMLNDAGNRLGPGLMADGAHEIFEEIPSYKREAEPGSRAALAWEVFKSGEPRYIPDTEAYEPLAEPSPPRCVLIHPIGRHGVFIIASPEPDAYDETDRALVDILASSLTAALDRVEREQHLRTRERRLEQQNERLSRFASIVSHDLRSPLSVARGRLELARRTGDDEHLDAIESAHERMERLIEGLLQLTVDGETRLTVDRIDLRTAAEASWNSVETADASLIVEATQTMSANENRLRELFENLFRNAVKHGPTNRPGDDQTPLTVTVGALTDGFYVEDDGTGIEPERRPLVFEAGHSTGTDGTGLGLSIVADIVAEHGWSVSVTGGRDGGARFEITGVDVDGEHTQ